MPTLDLQLRDSATRLLRKDWKQEGDVQRFADEVYALLNNLTSETTGSVQISNGDTAFVAAPLDSLGLQFLDFDAISEEEALGSRRARQPNDTQTEIYRYFIRRAQLLGIITARDNAGNYTVDIYPNGFDSAPASYTRVREVQSRTLDVGLSIIVLRVDTIEAAELKLDDGRIEGTRIKLIRRDHFFSQWTTTIDDNILFMPFANGNSWFLEDVQEGTRISQL